MRWHILIGGMITLLVPTAGASFARAETLDLACSTADGSRAYHVTIDLAAGLVSNEAGRSARRWAAVVTDKDVTWDEEFDDRIGHTANHYVFERSTGTLRGTDMQSGGSGREFLNAVCRNAS
jgi:hypothetical protein